MATDPASDKSKAQQPEKPAVFNTAPTDLMEGFRKAVLGNATLQAEVRQAKSAGDLVRVAAQHGFGFSEEEVRALRTLSPRLNLDEAQLEAVHLAAPCWCDPSVVNTRSC